MIELCQVFFSIFVILLKYFHNRQLMSNNKSNKSEEFLKLEREAARGKSLLANAVNRAGIAFDERACFGMSTKGAEIVARNFGKDSSSSPSSSSTTSTSVVYSTALNRNGLQQHNNSKHHLDSASSELAALAHLQSQQQQVLNSPGAAANIAALHAIARAAMTSNAISKSGAAALQLARITNGGGGVGGVSQSELDQFGNHLCNAVYSSNGELVKIICDRMAPYLPELRGPHNRTPLMIAAHVGIPEICEYLIVRRCPVNAQDSDGKSALHFACEAGNLEVCRLLLRVGADPNCIARDVDLHTPVSLAIGYGNAELLELLIDFRAKVDVDYPATRAGMRFLIEFENSFTLYQNRFEEREKRGRMHPMCVPNVPPNHEKKTEFDPNAPTEGGKLQTPLCKLDTEEAEFFNYMQSDAYIMSPCSPHLSRCERGLPLIIKKCPQLVYCKVTPEEHTPLHLCARRNFTNSVIALLQYGARDDSRDKKNGYLAIHEAVASGVHGNCLKALIEWHKEASPWKHLECKDSRFGMTPALVAAHAGRMLALRQLRDAGALMAAETFGGYSIHHLLTLSLGLTVGDKEMRAYYQMSVHDRDQKEEKRVEVNDGMRARDVGLTPFGLGLLKDVTREDLWIDGFLKAMVRVPTKEENDTARNEAKDCSEWKNGIAKSQATEQAKTYLTSLSAENFYSATVAAGLARKQELEDEEKLDWDDDSLYRD